MRPTMRTFQDATASLDRLFPEHPHDEQTFLTGESGPAVSVPEPDPEPELPNENSMVIYDSRGWRIDARPGEIKIRTEHGQSLTPADANDLMGALNFARGRARGQGEEPMHPW